MALKKITSLSDLHEYLQAALQLEHATIPPYLTALYSIHPDTNSDAYHVLRVVVVEEMLHLTLAANMLNAVGGTPDLTVPGFVPRYPAYLPDGEKDFQVNLERFSRAAIENFLQIERPASIEPRPEGPRMVRRSRAGKTPLFQVSADSEEHFFSIGEFYQEIGRGMRALEEEKQKTGGTIFTGSADRQVTSGFYYSGGGHLTPVTCLDSALEAIRLISEQGEGLGGSIYTHEGELSHFYRFEQLLLGRYYRERDQAGHPSGGPVNVNWDAVYPIQENASLADYPESSELHAAATAFNTFYKDFLATLTLAFQGQPHLLFEAVGTMFRFKQMVYALMRNPIPGKDGVHAAPTFEIAASQEATA